MNEEINNKDYKPLTPFKGWVIENFPFIEANFDAITNYELLCKVTEYLNNVIYNQNEVQELATELVDGYNALVNYVNEYFENLDVQTEINAKLDSMVENGTLTAIIGQYVNDSVLPLINSQNHSIEQQNLKISQIETKVDAATSGSPLVASNTSGMTDTSRVYVNTTDGKWYYYDGDSWEIGGTYQSTGLADNSVSLCNLTDRLGKQLFINCEDVSTLSWILQNNNANAFKYSSFMLLKKGTTITFDDDFVAKYHWGLREVNYGSYINFSTVIKAESTDTTYTLTADKYCTLTFRPIDDNWDSTTYTVNKDYIPTTSDITLNYYISNVKKDLLDDISLSYLRSLFMPTAMDGGVKRFFYNTTRIGFSKPIKSKSNIKVQCQSGYKYGVISWTTDTVAPVNFIADTGWMEATTEYTIPANTYFTLSFRRNDNGTLNFSELNDVVTFTSYGTFNYINNYVDARISQVGDNNYIGEKIDFQNKYGYETSTLIDYKTAANSQGFDIYNGYIVQLYANNTIRIVNISTEEESDPIEYLGFEHGDCCQFSKVKYDNDDMFPLLYITSDTTPSIVNVIRIVNTTTAYNIKKYDLGSDGGYYQGQCFDFENGLIYSFGYKANSFTSGTDNATIISVFDMNQETLISGSTYSLELLDRYEKPFIYCIQGQKFFKGKCFLVSSYNTAVSANVIYVYDPIRKLITSEFTNLPTGLNNTELEDIAFVLNSSGTKYDLIVGNRSYYYKLVFM